MKKGEQTKRNILQSGARIVHQSGYNNTGIQEILRSAGVPKGSFYFYFRNKQDFGLQLIDYYANFFYSRLDNYLQNSDESPLTRLRTFFSVFIQDLEDNKCQGGCPLGNLSQELGDTNEVFREKLNQIFLQIRGKIEQFLLQAMQQNEIPARVDTQDLAHFILNSWQGALLQMKVSKSVDPLWNFDSLVFKTILKPGGDDAGSLISKHKHQ